MIPFSAAPLGSIRGGVLTQQIHLEAEDKNLSQWFFKASLIRKPLFFLTGKPRITKLTKKVVNNSKVISCVVEGFPKPVVKWSINGSSVSEGVGMILCAVYQKQNVTQTMFLVSLFFGIWALQARLLLIPHLSSLEKVVVVTQLLQTLWWRRSHSAVRLGYSHNEGKEICSSQNNVYVWGEPRGGSVPVHQMRDSGLRGSARGAQVKTREFGRWYTL